MFEIKVGDALEVLRGLPAECFRTCVTSPPYWGLRDYGVVGQLGLEPTPEAYVAALVEVFREVRRVLTPDATLWLNLGDSYASVGKWGGSTGGKHAGALHGDSGIGRGKRDYGDLKGKDLVGIPWSVAFALRADGWWLRSDIIWAKPNPMPESVTSRPTRSHEYLFLLAKSERYFYDHEAVKEPLAAKSAERYEYRFGGEKSEHLFDAEERGEFGQRTRLVGQRSLPTGRNRRTVWTITPQPFKGAHFATFPAALVEPCVLAGSAPGDAVLDPFCGSGTVGVVAVPLGRHFLGIDLNPEYAQMARDRITLEAA